MSHILISYSHLDKIFAEALIQRIEATKFTSWIDSQDIRAGDNWSQEIDDAIEDSFAVIVIMTKSAKESEYVTYEWSYALGAKISVIPILLENTGLHKKLKSIQHVDFTENHRWERLIDCIEQAHKEQIIRIQSPSNAPRAIKRAYINLNSHDHEKRQMAARQLGNIPGAESDKGLFVALCDHHREVRKSAARALIDKKRELGEASDLSGLLKKLEDPYERKDVRRLAAWVLGAIGDDTVIEGLLKASHDSDDIVRAHAAGALGNFNRQDVKDRLIDMQNDIGIYHDDDNLQLITVAQIVNRALNLINIKTQNLSILEQRKRQQENKS